MKTQKEIEDLLSSLKDEIRYRSFGDISGKLAVIHILYWVLGLEDELETPGEEE